MKPETIHALKNLLFSEDEKAVDAAARALSSKDDDALRRRILDRMTPPRIIEILARYIDDDKVDAQVALRLFEVWEREPDECYAVRNVLEKAAKHLPTDRLVELAPKQLAALDLLVRQGVPEAFRPMAQMMTDDPDSLQADTLLAFANVKHPRVAELLWEFLNDSRTHESTGYWLAEAFGKLLGSGNSYPARALVKLLRSDDLTMRKYAIDAAIRYGVQSYSVLFQLAGEGAAR